jgi:hypothetical protein
MTCGEWLIYSAFSGPNVDAMTLAAAALSANRRFKIVPTIKGVAWA